MHTNEFEHAFSEFIDGQEYDEAENALFAIVRLAFEAGWRSAGGIPPEPRRIFELITPPKNPLTIKKHDGP